PGGETENAYRQLPLTAATRGAVEVNNGFAVKLLKEISSKEDGNVCISPISVSTAVSMFANGDDDESRDKALAVLGYSKGREGLETLNSYNSLMLENLPILDRTTRCMISNSLWNAGIRPFTADFKSTVSAVYNAESFDMHPGDSKGRERINQWIEGKTDGMIKTFLTEDLLSDVALVNACYFQGKWKVPFDIKDTTKDEFLNIDGTSGKAEFMKNKDVFYYSETDDACSVRMPYGNGNFAMYLLLPKEGYGLEDIMKPETVNTVVDNKELYEVDLRVPSFNHSYKCDLVGSLENLGMKKEFEGVVENDVYTLNMMLHGVEIKVDEEGTSSSSTTVSGMLTSPGLRDVEMVFNRPFIYFICEESTKSILFIGTVTKF
ncbi:MAG: hypothetical protein K2L68_08800, partial [Muribaculaceae bacterium]|nr:hypothetical protein [Muribaculaceae bacterium]